MFGSKFSSSPAHVKEGFDHVVDGTDLSSKTKCELFNKFASAHASGDPRKEIAAFKACVKEEFSWPWFEESRIKFELAGSLPYMWLRYKKDRSSLDFKLEILAHTVVMAVYSARDAKQRTGPFRASSVQGCVVEAQVAEAYNSGRLHGRPPFFPGDRTKLMSKR